MNGKAKAFFSFLQFSYFLQRKKKKRRIMSQNHLSNYGEGEQRAGVGIQRKGERFTH